MEGKWVRKLILIIACTIFSIGFFVLTKQNKTFNTINGEAKQVLEQMEKKDIAVIKEKIKETKKTNTSKKDTTALAKRFENAIVIGDSIAEGLVNYGVLPSNRVLSVRGASVDKIGKQIQQAIQYQPDVVFLEFGMNDLERFDGDADAFVTEYKLRIEELQSKLKYVDIYINNVLPIQQIAIDKVPSNAKYKEYNIALRKMCTDRNVTFINNDTILASIDDNYEKDGIHPKYAFYPKWAKRMADVAGL